MEYPDGCSTAVRYVARKVGLYNWKMILLWRCNFWIGELAYNTIALYRFQLWYFKGALISHLLNKLRKIQRKAALWITGVFYISST